MPRGEPGAVLTPEAAVTQAVHLAFGEVTAVGGERIRVEADSICVHGDSPGAARTAAAVRSALDEHGIKVEAFN
ncbi:hypothetical protein GCM10029992_09310 [Glycomyces albus]